MARLQCLHYGVESFGMKIAFVPDAFLASFRNLTRTCSGSVWPCRWLGLAGPFGPESEQVGGRAVPGYEVHFEVLGTLDLYVARTSGDVRVLAG